MKRVLAVFLWVLILVPRTGLAGEIKSVYDTVDEKKGIIAAITRTR